MIKFMWVSFTGWVPPEWAYVQDVIGVKDQMMHMAYIMTKQIAEEDVHGPEQLFVVHMLMHTSIAGMN